jgi:hypothetical protein
VNFLIATATFVDPSDGQMVYTGRTFVSAGSDVARSHPRNFKPATGHGSPSGFYRGRVETKRRPRTNSSERPSWLLETQTKSWRFVMPALKKTKKRFPHGSSVVAIQSFANADIIVREGDRFDADHPLVTANESWFVAEGTPTSEWPSTSPRCRRRWSPRPAST